MSYDDDNNLAKDTKNIVAIGASATGSDNVIQDLGTDYATQDALTSQVIKISCANANDTSNGSGARTVLLSGYDSNYNPQSEVISLNGQTAVNSTKSYILVRQLEVLTAGTGGTNAGIIYAGIGTVTTGVPATKYLSIVAATGSTRTGIYIVPDGYSMVVTGATINNRTATNACTVKLWVKPYGGVYLQKLSINSFGTSHVELNRTYVIPERSLVKITGNNATSTSTMSIVVDFRLVKDLD